MAPWWMPMRGVDQFAPMQLQPRDRTFLLGAHTAAGSSPQNNADR